MTEGRAGACGVRFLAEGVLKAPHGYVARWNVRAVETNTIYHVHPGKLALTFGMFGCDLKCPYCHNWTISQALREQRDGEEPMDVTADDIADAALATGCRVVCAAYNEPMIAAEWVRTVFAACRSRGLTTAIISDGHTTPEALAYVRPVTDCVRVDLKASDAAQYRSLGGRLEPVIECIRLTRQMGLWVEVATLIVPGFNDDEVGIKRLADTLVAIDAAVPWHLNAFHPRYRLADRLPTSAALLTSLAGIAYARGVRFVYVSNVHDAMPELEHTRCPSCHTMLIERSDYRARAVHLRHGACPECAAVISGIWS
ncbi:MAG: radical SAM protein [Myxococcota bacterium]|nr:radical SAM protein [Myxococcota bacterium]